MTFELPRLHFFLDFRPFLDYIEQYYIGKINEKEKVIAKPYFPISTWNLHNRIVNKKPRTYNKVERFNQKIQVDIGGQKLKLE